MKKRFLFSVLAAGALSSVTVQAAEDLSSMFSEGKTSGQIRMFSVDREYQGSAGTTTHRNGTALGGNLKFETADYSGLSLGTAFYTTNEIASSPTKDPSLFGANEDGYSILGEAYLQYKRGNTAFKAGRQKLDTPLAGSDDARMIPNLFEAYVLSNTDISDTTLIAAHVTKFAQGTFGRVYGGGILAATGGYSAIDDKNQVGDFVNMGDYAIGKATSGVTVAAAIYKMNEYVSAQVWDYYAHDILNAIYGQVDLNWKCLVSDAVHPFFSAQVIKENEVGDKLAGKINGMYVAGKFGAKVENFTAYIAYSQTGENSATDAATENAIITPWGGMPAFTQGMVTRHMFLAGTTASKIAGTYDFKDMGANVNATVYYTSFDMDANSGYGIQRTASESGFDVIYNTQAVKNLQLRLRGNLPRKFAESAAGDTGWDEYRFIVNYNF